MDRINSLIKVRTTTSTKPKKKIFFIKKGPFKVVERAFIELGMIVSMQNMFQRTLVNCFREIRIYLQADNTRRNDIMKILFDSHFIFLFVSNMSSLYPEERIEFTILFNFILKNNIRNCATEYMIQDEGIQVLNILITRYNQKDISVYCGSMIRECMHFRPLLMYYLNHVDLLLPLFTDFSHLDSKDIRLDIIYTLQELLLGHKECSDQRFVNKILSSFNQLLNTEYVDVQRMGLDLLFKFLILPTTPILLFIDNTSSLLAILPHLLSTSSLVQRQAYNVIKLFIIRPNKQKSIHDFLFNNRQKLIIIFSTIPYSSDDDVFLKERKQVICILQKLLPRESSSYVM